MLTEKRCGVRNESVQPEIMTLPAAERLSAEVVMPAGEEFESIERALREGNVDTWKAFRLCYRAEQLSAKPGFEKILCLEHLKDRWRKAGVVPYGHQVGALRRVIGPMRGRAILADEVGLGKTIEAGLVISEYILQGLVKRVLILTPASLCRQWQYEMQDKFGLRFLPARRPEDWAQFDLVIASIDTAKRPENAEALFALDFDMLVVDEAHKLKNCGTKNYALVSGIRKKFFLLLTATPLQNNLKELYNLITLLRPGQLGSYRAFRKHFVEDDRTPKNVQNLQRLLSEVVIRNRRSQTAAAFTQRHIRNVHVDLSLEESALYRRLENYLRRDYQRSRPTGSGLLSLITLQREICSSSFAAALTIAKMMNEAGPDRLGELSALFELARAVKENSKMKAVEEIVSGTAEKVIIFTEFIATQQYIMSRLTRQGYRCLAFDGRCSTSKKEWTKSLFRDHPGVRALVSTETGGEGINLQFCRTMINYDLPWNPMRIEQRIGRIHRLGQTRDVLIYNIFTRGTIEEHVLRLLNDKINLFQTVLGSLDRIIDVFGKGSFEQQLFEALFSSPDVDEAKNRLDELGDRLAEALDAKAKEETLDRLLFT